MPTVDDDPAECDDQAFGFISTGRNCRQLTAKVSVPTRTVVVHLPRACLGSPRWVQAAVDVHGGKPDSTTSWTDEWNPTGAAPDDWTGPYSPRVLRSRS